MIVVTVELHSAITGRVSRLGGMVIANDGTGSKSRGNYDAQLVSRNGAKGRAARVEGHAREALSVWVLVGKAIAALYPKH
jgi:hypothetical protein